MQYRIKSLSLIAVVLLLFSVAPAAYANSGINTVNCICDVGDSTCDTVTYSPTTLWPPDHTLQTITITGHDSDNENNLTVTVTGITDDQVPEDAGDGCGVPAATEGPDWTGIGNNSTGSNPVTSAEVRAERCANEGARTYNITVTCSEEGETGTVHLFVTVPKSQGP
jgi:hypothetical protein